MFYNGGESTPAQYNPFRYRGYYYDTDLGLYYLNSRYYDSVVGRFISADSYVSTGQGLTGHNMFAYCGNNPIMYADNTGDFPWLIFTIVVSAVVVYEFIANQIISEVNEEDEKKEEISEPSSNSNLLYYNTTVNSICDTTTNTGLEIGLYDETAELNEYNSINIDVAKATAEMGYTGAGAGVYLAEITGTNHALKLFGKEVYMTVGMNYGIGARFSVGPKTTFGISYGVGFVIEIEVK